MRTVVLDLLQRLFRLRPNEVRRTVLATLCLFAAVSAVVVGRIARTVLFLEIPRYQELLPYTYIVTALAIPAVMVIYARCDRWLRRDYLNATTLAFVAAVTVAFRLILPGRDHHTYFAFYIWVEMYGGFLIVQFWSLVNELFDAREAKRAFPIVASGGVLASVVAGFAVSGLAQSIGTENLLVVMAFLFASSLLMVLLLGQARGEHSCVAAKQESSTERVALRRVLADRYVKLLAVVVIVVHLVSTLTDYQLQIIVGEAIPGKDARSAFFGAFFGVTGVVAALFQFVLASRLLERFGILVALMLLPAAMLPGAAGLVCASMVPALWAILSIKGAENTLRYTIHDSTLQLLYLPLQAKQRSRVKTAIDGVLKPVAVGCAGIFMLVLTGQLGLLASVKAALGVTAAQLSWAVALLLVLWFVALVPLRRAYMGTLLRSLQRRHLSLTDAHFEISDEATIATLAAVLEGGDQERALHALDLARLVPPRLRVSLHEHMVALLTHASDAVRIAAIARLAESETHSERLVELLTDPVASVRGRAAFAVCAVLRERAVTSVRPLLADPQAEVQAAAVVALVRYGGGQGVAACTDIVHAMLRSVNGVVREQVARILGEVGPSSFSSLLRQLIEDPDERVRRAAIVAAGQLQAKDLLPVLMRELASSRYPIAVGAIAAYGSAAYEALAAVLADEEATPTLRANVCSALARIADRRIAALLQQYINHPSPKVRGACVAALVVVTRTRWSAAIDLIPVSAAMAREAQHVRELGVLTAELELDDRAFLLEDALSHRKQQARHRLLELVALKYGADTVDLVRRNLHSAHATNRANALEVLDNLVSTHDRALVVPLFDDVAVVARSTHAQEGAEATRTSRETRLRELCAGSDSWLRVCAVFTIGAWQLRPLASVVLSLLDDPDPLCRETSLAVLTKLGEVSGFASAVTRLRRDSSPRVRRFAEHIAAI